MNRARLQSLSPDRFKEVPGRFVVSESKPQATIRQVVLTSDDARFLVARFEEGTSTLFKSTSRCDGCAIEWTEGESGTAHLVELKSTLKEGNFDEVIGQIRASSDQIQMVADFLGIRLDQWTATIFCRFDRLSANESTNPAARRRLSRDLALPSCDPRVTVRVRHHIVPGEQGEFPLAVLGDRQI